MTKLQYGVLGGAFLLALLLYFGFDTRAPEYHKVEQRRAANVKTTDIGGLLREAKANLESTDMGEIMALEARLHDAPEGDTAARLVNLEELSGKWYSIGKFGVAAAYAEEIAEIRQTETAWSIAGINYTYCLQREESDKVKSYCNDQAIKAFETAYSMNPQNFDHQINLALVYVENPPSDNPMRGIRMLLDLNQQQPENVGVLVQLGRLAMKTNQFEKAVTRLEKAVSLQPQNFRANCLLADAYRGTNNLVLAEQYASRCSTLRRDLESRER